MENRSCIQQSLDKIEAELASEISVNELAKRQVIHYFIITIYSRKKSKCQSCSIL